MACPGISHPVQKHDDSEKVSVRKQALRARESLSFSGRDAGSRCVVERITALPAFRAAHTVMLYRAVRGELSLDALPGHPAAAGKRFVYPCCVSGTEMKALFPGGWKSGAFGIPEPEEASSEIVMPEEIGLVVCPGTAFDDRGTRLGMGAGYYDRFLPRCGNAAVAVVAFEAQKLEQVCVEETDRTMDCMVTEETVYRPEGARP